MKKRLILIALSIVFTFSFSISCFAAEPEKRPYSIGMDDPGVLEYPDYNSPFIQKYRESLYNKMVDPGKALALSAVYFGLGQIYSGDVNRGAWVLAGGTVLAAGILLVVVPRLSNRQESVKNMGNAIAYGTLAVGYLWNIRDAYSSAENVNRNIHEKLLLSNEFLKQLDKVSIDTNEKFGISYRLTDF
jgi:hypothetical protein